MVRQFYEQTLGLELVADESTALAFDATGTMLRVSIVPKFEPTPFTLLGWDVSDIEDEVRELTGRSVQFERFDVLEQ